MSYAPKIWLFAPPNKLAAAIGCSMAAIVAMERHLWISLAAKMTFFSMLCFYLLGTFGTSVKAVVDRLREAKADLAAFRKFITLCFKSSSEEDGQSRAEAHRQDQKSSVANCAPPLPSRSWWWNADTNRGNNDLSDILDKRRSDHPHPEAVTP
ncbi:Matrix metalloproteinase-14 [Labeo rohita]|uniref:Matrix metalloproteinase-14 n=1 Tax=Labeo rohita TaxID=84645 RepID=A0ABQ8L1N2_LABRO|nr:Matrix metalloproteinase-14 [Labeo rohita]